MKGFTKMKEETHTSEEWNDLINCMRCSVVKIPEWVYFHFLESVPPIYQEIGFFCGEPLCHNKEGNPVYYYFFKYKGSFFGTVSSSESLKFALSLAKEQIKAEVTE